MTENKRFTLEEINCFDYGIKVMDIIKDNGIELPQSTACDLLNQLSDENEQLKSELKALRKKYNDFSDAVDKRLQEMDKRLFE